MKKGNPLDKSTPSHLGRSFLLLPEKRFPRVSIAAGWYCIMIGGRFGFSIIASRLTTGSNGGNAQRLESYLHLQNLKCLQVPPPQGSSIRPTMKLIEIKCNPFVDAKGFCSNRFDYVGAFSWIPIPVLEPSARPFPFPTFRRRINWFLTLLIAVLLPFSWSTMFRKGRAIQKIDPAPAIAASINGIGWICFELNDIHPSPISLQLESFRSADSFLFFNPKTKSQNFKL